MLNSIRLNLKAVMLFLFAGEMIASTDGLAYRIALLRRHMGMDTIIPYVLWVALLLFLVDFGMNTLNRKLHPWFRGGVMPEIAVQIEKVHVEYPIAGQAAAHDTEQYSTGDRERRICFHRGPNRLRKIHAAAADSRRGECPRGAGCWWMAASGQQPDRRCGYVPQKYSLFPDKTVLDNVTFGLEVTEFGASAGFSPAAPRSRCGEFRAEALRYLRHTGLRRIRRAQVSAPAFGRNAAARGHRAGADHEAADSADGRGFQRAGSRQRGPGCSG